MRGRPVTHTTKPASRPSPTNLPVLPTHCSRPLGLTCWAKAPASSGASGLPWEGLQKGLSEDGGRELLEVGGILVQPFYK